MPFGLKTAPATFQKMMNNVLSGLTGTRCFVFLADIVIYENSLVDHDRKSRDVFKRLRKYNLKLQPDKCELFHNANLFGSCIIHILYTGCAKIKKKNNSGAKGLKQQLSVIRSSLGAVNSTLADVEYNKNSTLSPLRWKIW